MQPEIQRWLDFWDFLDGNFWRVWQVCQREFSPQEVCWQPIRAVASIGWNLQHLGEMLEYYLIHVFGQRTPVQSDSLVTMVAGSLDDGRFDDLDKIGNYHQKIRPAYRQYLATLTPDQLPLPIERQGTHSMTYAWAIAHIHEHESYHLGKCTLLRSMLHAKRKN